MSEINGVNVEVVSDYDALSRAAANIVVRHVLHNPAASLLVPTGTTPEGMYELLAAQPTSLFAGVSFYNLDEYCKPAKYGGYELLDPEDPTSYRYYMAKHLFRAHPEAKSFFPAAANAIKPGMYDRLIEEDGGIDLAFNSIGEDGHIFGFNFSGAKLDSKTRLVEVNAGTKAVNEKLTGGATPDYAITTGLSTGMRARQVITLVSGLRKAEILRAAIWDEVSAALPATILRAHPYHTFIVDQAAATNL